MKPKEIMKVKESWIEAQIHHYLSLKGIFAWKAKTVGTYDPVKKIFRKPGANYMRGVSDILGVLDGGRTLAIEVKTPTGRVSPEQKTFIEQVNKRGGLAFVARSVEDVKAKLEKESA